MWRLPARALIFSLILTLLAPVAPRATYGATGQPASRDDHARQLQRLEQGLAEQDALALQAWQREQEMLAELKGLDQEVAARQNHLKELEQQAVRQRRQIAALREELDRSKLALAEDEEHLRKRLAAAYRLGATGLLNILFTAQSLPELLEFQDNFQHLIERDRLSFIQYREQIARLEQAGRDLDQEKAGLQATIDAAHEQEAELQAARDQHAVLLQRVQNEKKLHQLARRQIKEATEKLRADMAELKARMEAEAAAERIRLAGRQGDFAAQKGKLLPPVRGPIISRFGQNEIDLKRVSSPDPGRGIAIAGYPGAEVYALYQGAVVFADKVEAYGNTVLIDHGNEYFSLVAGLGEILVKVGAEVAMGEIIGRLALKPPSQPRPESEPVLYFELRWGLRPIDPLPWLYAP